MGGIVRLNVAETLKEASSFSPESLWPTAVPCGWVLVVKSAIRPSLPPGCTTAPLEDMTALLPTSVHVLPRVRNVSAEPLERLGGENGGACPKVSS